MKRSTIRTAAGVLLSFILFVSSAQGDTRPNVIFIMADDLGYGELGVFGQEKIKTPSLDRMASEGMKWKSFYAGSTVCAPSRCVLMTGKHSGQARIRGNARLPLLPEDKTVAELFQESGYATALCGKWGLGEEGSTGTPNKQGFDYFFGYLNQHHAHNYYPTFLYRNEDRVSLRNVAESEDAQGGGWAAEEVDYSHDLVMEEAMQWLEKAKENPFFLYLSLTIPHANNERGRAKGNGQEVPDYGIYADKEWSDPDKGQAAMVTRMDRDIGRLLNQLKAWEIDEKTLVIFTSDNGHHKEGGNDPETFDANGPLRGMKRSLYEGGIRVPTVAWWPGTVKAGSETDHPAYFGDLFATTCEILQRETPEKLPSRSFLPTLQGRKDEQELHPYLYWEFYEGAGKQAVRFGKWKAVRGEFFSEDIELYDLEKNLGESTDLADQFPEIVRQATVFMNEAHVPDPNWTVRKPRS